MDLPTAALILALITIVYILNSPCGCNEGFKPTIIGGKLTNKMRPTMRYAGLY